MPNPWLHDDGSTVTLDLHGATVDEAVALTHRTVREAVRRGRTAVKIIHGASTSRRLAPNRTIRQAIHDLLDQRAFAGVVDARRTDVFVTLALDLTATPDLRPIRLRDLPA